MNYVHHTVKASELLESDYTFRILAFYIIGNISLMTRHCNNVAPWLLDNQNQTVTVSYIQPGPNTNIRPCLNRSSHSVTDSSSGRVTGSTSTHGKLVVVCHCSNQQRHVSSPEITITSCLNSHIDRVLWYNLTSHLITRSLHMTRNLNTCFFAAGYNSLTLFNLELPFLIITQITCSVLVALIPFSGPYIFILQLYNPWVPISRSVAHRPISIENYWRSSARKSISSIARYCFSVYFVHRPRKLY